MKKNLLASFIFIMFIGSTEAQQLVSYQQIASYNNDQVDSIFVSNFFLNLLLTHTYGVTIYKVDYNTLDAFGNTILASGAFLVPQEPICRIPLASYQHGTE